MTLDGLTSVSANGRRECEITMATTSRKSKRPHGRPRKRLDRRQIEKLAEIQCTNEGIAGVMGCSLDTIVPSFSESIKRGRERGKMGSRRLLQVKSNPPTSPDEREAVALLPLFRSNCKRLVHVWHDRQRWPEVREL